MDEASLEKKLPSPEKISKAYEDGVLLGSQAPEPSESGDRTASPERKHHLREELTRAYKEGVLIGTGLSKSSHEAAIGTSSEESGAFELGLERGHEITETYPDPIARSFWAGHAVATYEREQDTAN